MIVVNCKLLSVHARIPARATPGSAGYDLRSVEDCTIEPGSRKLISTGVAFKIPSCTYGRIASRSGLSLLHSIDVCAGVIDSDYTGEIKVLLANNGQQPYKVFCYEKIAQIIFEKIESANIRVVPRLEATERACNGFGSSGY